MTIDRSEVLEVADWVIENIPDKAQFTHAQALLTLAAEVRRLRERERVLVDTVKLYACKDFWKPYQDDRMGLTTKAASDRGSAARAALEAVKE